MSCLATYKQDRAAPEDLPVGCVFGEGPYTSSQVDIVSIVFLQVLLLEAMSRSAELETGRARSRISFRLRVRKSVRFHIVLAIGNDFGLRDGVDQLSGA